MSDHRKPNVPVCGLKGCDRTGVLEITMYDKAYPPTLPRSIKVKKGEPTGHIGGGVYVISDRHFCCKTHMLRHLSKQKMPRYSNKRAQRLAGTQPLKAV